MSDKLEISISGPLPRPEIELTPAAYNARQVALIASGNVKAIASVQDLDAAGAALTNLKGLEKAFEAAFKDAKAPVLDIGKRIDAIKRDYLESITAESKRLSILVGGYQEAQRAKAERVRQEEAARQAEALAAMQQKQAEANATGDEAAADAARAEAAAVIATSQLTVIAAEGPRADGIASRTSWKFEVTDATALYAARPELCIIQPNNTVIKAAIKASRGASIPGLRIWQEAGAIVRGANPVKVDDYDY